MQSQESRVDGWNLSQLLNNHLDVLVLLQDYFILKSYNEFPAGLHLSLRKNLRQHFLLLQNYKAMKSCCCQDGLNLCSKNYYFQFENFNFYIRDYLLELQFQTKFVLFLKILALHFLQELNRVLLNSLAQLQSLDLSLSIVLAFFLILQTYKHILDPILLYSISSICNLGN